MEQSIIERAHYIYFLSRWIPPAVGKAADNRRACAIIFCHARASNEKRPEHRCPCRRQRDADAFQITQGFAPNWWKTDVGTRAGSGRKAACRAYDCGLRPWWRG